jgi:hypothetical protein
MTFGGLTILSGRVILRRLRSQGSDTFNKVLESIQ